MISLRLRAVFIAGFSLIFLWACAAGWMLQGVHTQLDNTLDERLAMSARMVAGLLQRSELTPELNSSQWSDAVQVGGGDGIACEIRSVQGQILARTAGGPHSALDQLAAGYSTKTIAGQQWRLFVLYSGAFQITTADRLEYRALLIREVLWATGVPFLVAVIGGLLMLWLSIGQGLAPLNRLCEQLRLKTAEDTEPLDPTQAPVEVRPLLEAMNGLLERLTQVLSSQRAFTDAAAHELRTPLTVIDTHLQVARLATGREAEDSMRDAAEGVQRLRHILEQMMLLTRTDAPLNRNDGCDSVSSVIFHVINVLPEVERQRISLYCGEQDWATTIPKPMLETMLRNLVDNALRYSPEHSLVELDVQIIQPKALIKISDRGPGLKEEQMSRLGQRFWRAEQSRHKQGAGLGSSIVQSICERFGATIVWKARAEGGLVAELQIPLLHTNLE